MKKMFLGIASIRLLTAATPAKAALTVADASTVKTISARKILLGGFVV